MPSGIPWNDWWNGACPSPYFVTRTFGAGTPLEFTQVSYHSTKESAIENCGGGDVLFLPKKSAEPIYLIRHTENGIEKNLEGDVRHPDYSLALEWQKKWGHLGKL